MMTHMGVMVAKTRKLSDLSSGLIKQDPLLSDGFLVADPAVWTIGEVRGRLEEAVDTLLRLPMPLHGKPAKFRCQMPEIVRSYWEAYGYNQTKTRFARPTAKEIQRMDDALGWLLWLPEKRDRQMVFLSAIGFSLRKIANALDASHEWARLVILDGHMAIARHLNAQLTKSA